MPVLVTGGCGFIGSNFIHTLSKTAKDKIVCIDKITYAADFGNISDLDVELHLLDINNCEYAFQTNKIKTIFHFAAESHVDNSIKDPSNFLHTNINGTVNLLNLALKYEVEKFIHISTDEVYGSIDMGHFTENTPYSPRNPYSASKASSDHFVMSYHNTYGLPAIVTNCSNNYGPRQYQEKMIPKIICNLHQNKKVPVYGDGQQIRDWIYVQDHCEALLAVSEKGKFGEKYNIGGKCEIKNIDLVKKIINLMGKDESYIDFVQDRPGHDRRYATDITKISTEIGWTPRFNFDDAIQKTISHYID
jgi:dTDP-glucose 4,6-dehydratase